MPVPREAGRPRPARPAKPANWFAKLSKDAQRDYIKKHPNSIYAKNVKPSANHKPAAERKENRNKAKEYVSSLRDHAKARRDYKAGKITKAEFKTSFQRKRKNQRDMGVFDD